MSYRYDKVRARFIIDNTVDDVRRTKTCKKGATEKEAKTQDLEMRAAMLRGVDTASLDTGVTNCWTLEYARKKTLDKKWRGTRGERTAELNSGMCMKYFGRKTLLTDITLESVDDYIEMLRDSGNSNATINRKLTTLSTIMHYATKYPTSGFKEGDKPKWDRLPEYEGRLRWLEPEEEAMILQTLTIWDKLDHRDVVEVLIDMGLRESELWKITKIDVRFNEGYVFIQSRDTEGNLSVKNNVSKPVPMTKRVAAIFKRRLETHGDRPFPYKNAWLRHVWDRVRGHMNLTKDREFIPYVMRHTCASRLVQRGASIKVIMEWLGHKKIETTMRYAKLAPKDLLNAVHLLEPEHVANV